MMDRKFKIPVAVLIAAMQTFFILPCHAHNLFIQEKDSCPELFLAEALVEYPYGWFYTLDEIEEIYQVEYYENNRLASFIRHENGKFINPCHNELSEIPDQFIETTLRLIEQMLDQKLTRYLFRLDTFHGHFFVPDEQFAGKYLNLNTRDMIIKLVNDNSLGVLFHCAEHMALRNPPHTGTIDKEAQELIKLRNIIGWYNTGSIEVVSAAQKGLVGNGKSNTSLIPQGFRGVGSITFKANINGEFSIKHAGQTIKLDISLCDYYYH